MNSTTRTFRAKYLVIVETAVLSAHDYLLTFTGYGDSIQITLNGKRCSKAIAEVITRLALNLGTFERLSGPSLEAPQPIGKKRAHAMHVELARHGYPTNHYDLASGVLGREVASLAVLTEPEARTVWTALVYGARVAA